MPLEGSLGKQADQMRLEGAGERCMPFEIAARLADGRCLQGDPDTLEAWMHRHRETEFAGGLIDRIEEATSKGHRGRTWHQDLDHAGRPSDPADLLGCEDRIDRGDKH